MSKLRIIPYQDCSAQYNMAADELLLNSDGPVLRTYGWKEPTLSLGRFSQNASDVDLDFCAENGIKLVRRMTGGKNVLHQHELTYCFSANISSFSNSILGTYKLIAGALLFFFEKLGLQTELGEKARNESRSSICFNQVSAYEISIHHKKLVGSAQYRNSKRFIQHGSILLDIDWKLWKKVWGLEEDSNILEKRITCLNEELNKKVSPQKLEMELIQAFCSHFGYNAEIGTFSVEEFRLIEDLEKKYIWQGFEAR